jgi:hypothetical protein
LGTALCALSETFKNDEGSFSAQNAERVVEGLKNAITSNPAFAGVVVNFPASNADILAALAAGNCQQAAQTLASGFSGDIATDKYNTDILGAYPDILKDLIPNELKLTAETTPPSCGLTNGSITLTATGGTAPYQYSFDNGTTWQASSTQEGLCPATYGPFKVKDAKGTEASSEAVELIGPETLELKPADVPIVVVSAQAKRKTNTVGDEDEITLTFEGKTVTVKVGAAYTTVTNSPDIMVNGKRYTPFFIACSKEFYGFYESTCTASPCTITTYENNSCGDGKTVRLVYEGKERCKECWLEVDEIEKNIMIFSKGYTPLADIKESDNSIESSDSYWVGLDRQFTERRKPDFSYYADGGFSITTSNHNKIPMGLPNAVPAALAKFAFSIASSLNALSGTPGYCLNATTRCVVLNTEPNPVGYAKRFHNGEKFAAVNLISKMKEIKTTAKKVIYNIDIVAHSMGFAYAQGIIEGLKNSDEMKDKIKWGGYYIIAPENGCGGSVTVTDWKDQVWQYGSNLGQDNADPLWLQDGVAPQCAVGGLGDPAASIPNGRAYIPNTYTTTRGVSKTRITGYETDPMGNPIPIYETYTDYTTEVPKGFTDSHSIVNYGWIFEIKPNEPTGYVTPK